MFAVAIKGYGIVVWDDADAWRVYTASASMSAQLSARVEAALASISHPCSQHEACEALLTIAGAGLLSIDCDHAPGDCDGETTLN